MTRDWLRPVKNPGCYINCSGDFVVAVLFHSCGSVLIQCSFLLSDQSVFEVGESRYLGNDSETLTSTTTSASDASTVM